MAETVRDAIYSEETLKTLRQANISLVTVANRSTWQLSGAIEKGSCKSGDGGLFGVGPVLDLRAFSSGKFVLGGISFDVASSDGARQSNCAVVARANKKSVKAPPIATSVFKGAAQARAIAFLHTSLVEEPQVNLRKIGEYVVEYANGSSTTVDLLENWNITDIRSSVGLRRNDWTFTKSPDVLIGAKLAWRGASLTGIPLNVQMLVWRNPYPEHRIIGIRMSAAKAPPDSQLALLGLTFLQ
jgi:hypothetical protein